MVNLIKIPIRSMKIPIEVPKSHGKSPNITLLFLLKSPPLQPAHAAAMPRLHRGLHKGRAAKASATFTLLQ